MAEVIGVDTVNHRVVLSDGAVDYDTLIVATGASHQYFGHDDWEKFAPGLKTRGRRNAYAPPDSTGV